MFKLAVRQSVERRSKSLLVNMNSSPSGDSWFVVRRSQSSLFLSLRMLSLLGYNSVSILGVHYAIFQPLATVIISTNTLTSLEKVSIPSIFGRLAAVRGRYASRRIYWSRKWCTQIVGEDKTDDGEDGNFTVMNRYRSYNRAK